MLSFLIMQSLMKCTSYKEEESIYRKEAYIAFMTIPVLVGVNI